MQTNQDIISGGIYFISELYVKISHPGFEGQKYLGQKQDEAFQAYSDELEHKVGDAHHPDQVKEVVVVQVGSGKYET